MFESLSKDDAIVAKKVLRDSIEQKEQEGGFESSKQMWGIADKAFYSFKATSYLPSLTERMEFLNSYKSSLETELTTKGIKEKAFSDSDLWLSLSDRIAADRLSVLHLHRMSVLDECRKFGKMHFEKGNYRQTIKYLGTYFEISAGSIIAGLSNQYGTLNGHLETINLLLTACELNSKAERLRFVYSELHTVEALLQASLQEHPKYSYCPWGNWNTWTLYHLARIQKLQGSKTKAAEHFASVRNLWRNGVKNGSTIERSKVLLYLAEIELENHNLESATANLIKSKAIINDHLKQSDRYHPQDTRDELAKLLLEIEALLESTQAKLALIPEETTAEPPAKTEEQA